MYTLEYVYFHSSILVLWFYLWIICNIIYCNFYVSYTDRVYKLYIIKESFKKIRIHHIWWTHINVHHCFPPDLDSLQSELWTSPKSKAIFFLKQILPFVYTFEIQTLNRIRSSILFLLKKNNLFCYNSLEVILM